ncbi:MAG: hypothetical protein QNJ97_01105 [Myxococcota bacterium]|nr:hypothetical protein [Myxococcota bacterium]
MADYLKATRYFLQTQMMQTPTQPPSPHVPPPRNTPLQRIFMGTGDNLGVETVNFAFVVGEFCILYPVSIDEDNSLFNTLKEVTMQLVGALVLVM